MLSAGEIYSPSPHYIIMWYNLVKFPSLILLGKTTFRRAERERGRQKEIVIYRTTPDGERGGVSATVSDTGKLSRNGEITGTVADRQDTLARTSSL